MGIAYNVLVHSPRDGRLMPVACEILAGGKKTSRVRLPNGDVIKVRNERLVVPPVGGNIETVDGAPPPDTPFFVGMKVQLHDGTHKVNVLVSRIAEDAVFFELNGKEYQLHEEQLYDPNEPYGKPLAMTLKEVPDAHPKE